MCKFINAGIFALAVAAQCHGQPIQVAQGGNPSDGSTWVTLTMQSQTSYPLANGAGKFTPSLTVRCESKGKPRKEERTLGILLDTGGVQPGALNVRGNSSELLADPKENPLRLSRENLLFRMTIDTGRPQRRRWELLPASDTVYQYWGGGDTPVTSVFLPGEFIDKMFTAKVVTIEFQPFGHVTYGQENLFGAQFHPVGLKDEFRQHKECSLK
jgi:hypothetical protein